MTAIGGILQPDLGQFNQIWNNLLFEFVANCLKFVLQTTSDNARLTTTMAY
jgi:hypothetical protein